MRHVVDRLRAAVVPHVAGENVDAVGELPALVPRLRGDREFKY